MSATINRSNILRVLLSLLLSLTMLVALFWLLYQNVSTLDQPQIGQVLSNIEVKALSAYVALYLITTMLRAVRYKTLLACTGTLNQPSYMQMLGVTAVRNMLVDVLPARVGEFSFVGLLNKLHGVPIANALSTLMVSLVFDLIALSVMVLLFIVMTVLIAAMPLGHLQSFGSHAWLFAVSGFACAISAAAYMGFFVILPATSTRLNKFRKENNPRYQLFLRWLQEFSHSLLKIKQARKAMSLIGLSVAIRSFKYLGLCLLFYAITSNSFPELAVLNQTKVLMALIGGEFASSLPIPNFMGFGLYEASGVAVFHMIGVVDTLAAATALLCSHIVSQLLEYSVGGVALAILLIVARERRPKTRNKPC